jgi:hypothetical protein
MDVRSARDVAPFTGLVIVLALTIVVLPGSTAAAPVAHPGTVPGTEVVRGDVASRGSDRQQPGGSQNDRMTWSAVHPETLADDIDRAASADALIARIAEFDQCPSRCV